MEWVKQYALYIAITLGMIIGALMMWWLSPNPQDKAVSTEEWLLDTTVSEAEGEPSQVEGDDVDTVIVDIKGQVKQPGVYELKSGERVVDAIEIAGGFLEEADKQSVNLAQKLTDEMVVYIAKVGEESVSVMAANNNESDGKININQATVTELETLPGIGPSKAEDIVAHREKVDLFKTIEDLKEISGIGEKTFEKLKDLITVN